MSEQDMRYTEQHEWIRREGETATVGITDHAQDALGDITFVELPEVGKELGQGDEGAAIESAKAAASIYAPAGGTVTEVNGAVEEDPSLVNSDPTGQGWIFKLALTNPAELDELMDDAAYKTFLAEQE